MTRSYIQWTIAAAGAVFLAASIAAQAQAPAPQGGAAPAAPAAPAGGARQGGGAGAAGGRGGAPAPERNLTVLPKDIPGPQLVQIMQGFESALGVTCEHCHVYVGRGNPMNNMASDEKPAKKTTRLMMVMARDFNTKLVADVGKPAPTVTRVQCGTCHRGSAIPKYEAPAPPAAPAAAPGAPAGGGRPGGAGGAGN